LSFNFVEFKGAGGGYLSENEKKDLAAKGTVFGITAAVFEEGQGYEGKNRFKVTLVLDDKERFLSFQAGSVESRDDMLKALGAHLEAGNGPEYAKLVKAGRAFLIEGAEAPAASF
jgi:hypothetical protein